MSKGNLNMSGAVMGGAEQPYISPFGNQMFMQNPGAANLPFQNGM